MALAASLASRPQGLPLFFRDSRKVGLGLYSAKGAANAIEYGSVAVGAALYLDARRRMGRHGDASST